MTDEFLQQNHSDLGFKQKEISLDVDIYTGDIDNLLNMEVSMYGCVSGACIETGTIIDTCVDSLRINKKLYSGVFAILLKGKENKTEEANAYDKQRFAREGDSGAIVFGYDKNTQKHIAIGLVLGKNDE